MKKFFLALAALSLSFTAFAAGDDDAFYGKIENTGLRKSDILSLNPNDIIEIEGTYQR